MRPKLHFTKMVKCTIKGYTLVATECSDDGDLLSFSMAYDQPNVLLPVGNGSVDNKEYISLSFFLPALVYDV